MSARRICLGRIVAAHGVRGQVKVESYAAEPEGVVAYGPLTDESGARAFALTLAGRWQGGIIAAIEGVTDRTAAEGLRGVRLFVERDRLPDTAAGTDEYYHADLIGLAVCLPDGRRIGQVIDLANFGAGDLLDMKLDGENGRTVYLPFVRAVVTEIDLARGSLTVDPPDGLLDTRPPPGEPGPGDDAA